MTHRWSARIIVAVGICLAFDASASQTSANFTISSLRSQENGDIIHVAPSSGHTLVNPNSCAQTDAYAEDSALTGHKERTSLLMGAFLNKKTLSVTVSGCVDGRPKIVMVQLFQ